MNFETIEKELTYLKTEIYPHFASILAYLRKKKTNQNSINLQNPLNLPNIESIIWEINEDQSLINQLAQKHNLYLNTSSASLTKIEDTKDAAHQRKEQLEIEVLNLKNSNLMIHEDFRSLVIRYLDLTQTINSLSSHLISKRYCYMKLIHSKNLEKRKNEIQAMEIFDLTSKLKFKLQNLQEDLGKTQTLEWEKENMIGKMTQDYSCEKCKIGEQEILKKQYEEENEQAQKQLDAQVLAVNQAQKSLNSVSSAHENLSRSLCSLSIQSAVSKESFEKILNYKSDQSESIQRNEKMIENLKNELKLCVNKQKDLNINKINAYKLSKVFDIFKFMTRISMLKRKIKNDMKNELVKYSLEVDSDNLKEIEEMKDICSEKKAQKSKRRTRNKKNPRKDSEQVVIPTENLAPQRRKKTSEPSLAGIFNAITSIKSLPKDTSLSYASKKKSSSLFEDLSDSFFH